MTKQKTIQAILEEAEIHHNIRINYNKMPDTPDILEGKLDDNFVWEICEYMVQDFANTFKDIDQTPINDSGNRNLGYEGCELKGEIYTYGRSGATLYWDKYWKGENRGFGFVYEEDELEEMKIDELREILKDIRGYNELVENLMIDFYEECASKMREAEEEMILEKERASKPVCMAWHKFEVDMLVCTACVK